MSETAPTRSIELTIEVEGTVDEVWTAVATGPGISSWYVPHTVEERQGGVAIASFGPGEEMTVTGRVAVWEPPRRVVFDGGDEDDGMAFEWTVEPLSDSSCRVRLLNTGFSADPEADDYYNAMCNGWQIFLDNLQIHQRHFAPQLGSAMLPAATWSATASEAWAVLTEGLGIPDNISIGQQLSFGVINTTMLSGKVAVVSPFRVSLILDSPVKGTAFIAAEEMGGSASVSVWAYLYGDYGARIAEADTPDWLDWLVKLEPGD